MMKKLPENFSKDNKHTISIDIILAKNLQEM